MVNDGVLFEVRTKLLNNIDKLRLERVMVQYRFQYRRLNGDCNEPSSTTVGLNHISESLHQLDIG
jgi:hypothetical protein